MRAEPKTILNFLSNYFDVVRELFEIQQKEGIIRREALHLACERNESYIHTQLTEYKILKKVNEDFEFQPVFNSLVQFLLQEFKPILPQTIEKYHTSISQLFRKTKESVHIDKVVLAHALHDLSNEIRSFYEHVERNTTGLLKETRELKANIEKIGYRDKVLRACRWIEEFILPLNKILDVNQADSVANHLYDIAHYANQKRLSFDDETVRLQFERLYNLLIQTNDDLLKQSKILTNELLPLIERIKTESFILTGWIEFLNNPFKVATPKIYKREREYPYAGNIYLNTKEYFEQFYQEDNMYLTEDTSDQEKWIFNKPMYKDKLVQTLPVGNFFEWCYSTLEDEYKVVETDKFFSLMSLIFEEDIQIEFPEKVEYEEIKTNTSVIRAPKLRIHADKLS